MDPKIMCDSKVTLLNTWQKQNFDTTYVLSDSFLWNVLNFQNCIVLKLSRYFVRYSTFC